MALGSHLLKHYVVSKYCGVPWRETKITRDDKHKPVYVDLATGRSPIYFNVSHQAGIVALAAVHGYRGEKVNVGVDVVCTSERRERDHETAGAPGDGWPRFVDIHADVFADSEVNYLKYQIPSAVQGFPKNATAEVILDFKLRCFYSLWCLREAYVKMRGDALVAEWLKNLEFRDFEPPSPTESFDVPAIDDDDGESGQIIRRHGILLHKRPITHANMALQSLGPDYMCCTAVQTPQDPADGMMFRLGTFEMLDLQDIVSFAESKI